MKVPFVPVGLAVGWVGWWDGVAGDAGRGGRSGDEDGAGHERVERADVGRKNSLERCKFDMPKRFRHPLAQI